MLPEKQESVAEALQESKQTEHVAAESLSSARQAQTKTVIETASSERKASNVLH
jgi:hypothetical protein